MVARRVLFDTNVLVSAIAFGGRPSELVQRAFDGTIIGVTSVHVLEELHDVLVRSKFAFSEPRAASVVRRLTAFLEVVPVEQAHARLCRDPGDDLVLAAGIVGKVDVVVSGDRHLLELTDPPVPIVTVERLLSELG